jgi:FKBP-type peptidyl-prolyl cis-trans isomerase 2
MRFERKRHAALFLLPAILAVLASGCEKSESAPAVEAGDEVRVHYTCRLKGGELAATTRREAAGDASVKKSPLFSPETAYEPLLLTAGPGEAPEYGRTQNLKRALSNGLSEAVVGMRVGEERRLQLEAEVPPGLAGGERFLEMARVRKRDKEKTMSAGLYAKFQKDKAPEVGQQIALAPGFTGTVTSVSGDQVALRVSAEPGTEIDTLFGKGTIFDRGDHYEIEIDARKGSLIRMGNLVGRITEVDEELITTDFGHPFGGEVLVCDVKLEGIERKAPAPGSRVVREGDWVEAEVTVSLADGSPVSASEALGDVHPAAAGEAGAEGPVLQSLLAGSAEPPLGLGEAVIGMAAEETKKWELPPERAKGPWDPAKLQEFPRVRREPRTFRMKTEQYAKKTGSFPKGGDVVNLLPYFKTRVVQAGVEDSLLEHLAGDGEAVEDGFGTTEIRVEGEEIVLTLTPRVGAAFEADGLRGRVRSAGDDTFTVDLNHPLAGKALVVSARLVSLIPGSEFRSRRIPWIEDHEAGLAAARRSGKPAVLVLYADWCAYSRRLFDETFEDPRIKALEDRFVWVKVNSDLQSDLQALYRQQGFPTIVLLSPDGQVAKTLDGFKDAATLRSELGAGP